MAVFLALSVLMLVMVTLSVLSLRSLTQAHNDILGREAEDMRKVSELGRLHEERVSNLRAFLISRSARDLAAERGASLQFAQVLDSLSPITRPHPRSPTLIQHLRGLDQDFDRFVQRALRESSKRTWILDTLVRPRRIELERGLSELNDLFRQRLDASNQAFQKGASRWMKTIMVVGAGEVLFLLGLGFLLLATVREEHKTLTRLKEARDTLEQAERRAALLARTGRIVIESSDPKETLPRVAELTVEWLAGLCLIELTEETGQLRAAALAISRVDRRSLLQSLHANLPQGLGSLFESTRILETGRPALATAKANPKLAQLGFGTFVGVPLRARNKGLGILLLVRWDTDRPYDELQLRLAEDLGHQIALAIDNARLLRQAEAGLRMREELLSTVAHDLKNPLTGIRMNAELLERAGVAPATAMQESVVEMEQLIHDLLDLTKIESGRIVLDRSPQDAETLIDTCLNVLAPQAKARGIELIKEVRTGECIADCDRNRVIQVLQNLVGNAVKFTERGGRVRVEAQATGEGIRFSVVDNGPGIRAEELPHIFDRYWQARRNRAGSAGLGLSIARGIVEAHGGRLWVESALQIGSRFFFTLPEARRLPKTKSA
jgi:signal transduction histidine kinase